MTSMVRAEAAKPTTTGNKISPMPDQTNFAFDCFLKVFDLVLCLFIMPIIA